MRCRRSARRASPPTRRAPTSTGASCAPLLAPRPSLRVRWRRFAVNQNKEFRQGFRAEPKPYHPVTGEMSAWMHNAYESRTRIPFTGKYPS